MLSRLNPKGPDLTDPVSDKSRDGSRHQAVLSLWASDDDRGHGLRGAGPTRCQRPSQKAGFFPQCSSS